MKQSKSSNPERIQLIRLLKKQSHERKANIWNNVAKYLAKSRPQRTSVNLSKINRYTEKNDTVIVPGKVLGTGSLDHRLTIAAFKTSKKAREKIEAAKATYLSIQEIVKKKPKGTKIKIIR